MDIVEAANKYEDFFIIEKGLSNNTYLAYKNDLNLFFSFLKKQNITATENITLNHITNFLSERSPKITNSSLNREKSVIKNFLLFCLGIKVVAEDFSDFLKMESKEDFFPAVLSREEMDKLFQYTEQEKEKKNISLHRYRLAVRNELMLEMLYALGLRVSEATGIRINNIDEGGWCQIQGKGNKTRTVPLLPGTLKKIKFYLQEIRPLFNPSGNPSGVSENIEPYLFVNKNGKKLSRISVWKWVKEVARSCEINKNISPHTFRHTCATHLLQNGADLRIIQELVGHSNIQTTEIYTHLLTDDVRKTFSTYHPLYK